MEVVSTRTSSIESHPTKSLQSVASRSTESLKSRLDLEFQTSHAKQSVLQDRTLEEQFGSCVALCKKNIDEALVSAKISSYAKTCFHPIAGQIDDELVRLEIWAFDVGTKDGFWKEFSKLVAPNVAVSRRVREIFEDMNSSLEKIEMEMKRIQFIVEDAAESTQNLNDSWTMRVDEAVSQVNSNINIFSSAVRTFISQRSLTGLEVAIESKKGLYDRFRNESDNSIDSLRKKRESRIGTIQNEQDEQNLKFQRENNEKSKRKVEDSMFTIFDRAASPERKSKKEPANPTATDDASWKICNLLCLDGGGIRGYWSLLVLQRLMESIATEEERITEEEKEDKGIDITEEEDGKETCHSFWPQPWPENAAIAHALEALEKKIDELSSPDAEDPKAKNPAARLRTLTAAQRYLPCHYFDYIGGTSTGGLIAIMLGRFRMTVPDCMSEYESLGAKMFGRPRHFTKLKSVGLRDRPKYSATNLKKVFEDLTERRSEKMSEGQRRIAFQSRKGLCNTFVTSEISQSYQPDLRELYLIRSYDHFERISSDQIPRNLSGSSSGKMPLSGSIVASMDSLNISGGRNLARKQLVKDMNYGSAQNFEIWEVARAATAAPFFFEPLKIAIPRSSEHMSLTDAGFGDYNNPTKEGNNEIERMYGTESIGIIVSVGTARRDKGNRKVGPFAFKSMMEQIAQKATDTGRVHADMETKSSRDGFPYYRMNDPDGVKMKLDEWEPKPSRLRGKISGSKTLETIRIAFDRWASNKENEWQIRSCAKELVRCRRARLANRAKWERYATGAEFVCRVLGCSRENFDNRDQFQKHLAEDHGVGRKDLENEVKACRSEWRYQAAPKLTSKDLHGIG